MLDSSPLTKSYLSIKLRVREEERQREREGGREGERGLVASGGLCGQINIRLMSPAPGPAASAAIAAAQRGR